MINETNFPSESLTNRDLEKSELRRSIMDRVREGLRNDRRVFYAGELLSGPSATWIETMDIAVAPISPTYEPARLNAFIDSLVPDLSRTSVEGARQGRPDLDYYIGVLTFDESIGTIQNNIHSVVIAQDPDALERAGIQVGETDRRETTELQRRTWVRVYPEVSVAQAAFAYQQGVRNGSIERDINMDLTLFSLSPDQLTALKRTSRNSNSPLGRLLESIVERK